MTDVNRVAIVDDDPAVGMVCEAIAQRTGAITQRWEEPRAFLAALDQWQPTHVVLDMRMPAMNGADVLAELARRQSPVRLILTSGELEEAHAAARHWSALLNITGVLPKPFRAGALRVLLGLD